MTPIQRKPGFAELAQAAKLNYSGVFLHVEMYSQRMLDGSVREVMVADAESAGFIVFIPADGDGVTPVPLQSLITRMMDRPDAQRIGHIRALAEKWKADADDYVHHAGEELLALLTA